MRSHIADSRGRASANQDRRRALHYDIGGAGTDAHIANSGCRHARNNDGRAAGRYYGTSHMRYHPGHHRASMHIRDSRGRRHTASFRVPVGPKDPVLCSELPRGLPRSMTVFRLMRRCLAGSLVGRSNFSRPGCIHSEKPSRARNALSVIGPAAIAWPDSRSRRSLFAISLCKAAKNNEGIRDVRTVQQIRA